MAHPFHHGRASGRPLFLHGLLVLWLTLAHGPLKADRIYILPGLGYNQCDMELWTAIQANGHFVFVDAPTANSVPPGFTSTCVDPVNGYDWLCLFGSQDRSAMLPSVQAFMAVGGKVFLQWEVVCCTGSATGSANIAAGATGAPITPHIDPYTSFSGTSNLPGWEAVPPNECWSARGSAFRCMNGLPTGAGLAATSDLNGGTPSYTTCPYFGFRFVSAAMPGGNGGLLGFGDVNIWYLSAGEPPNNAGTLPVDTVLVDMVFPNTESTCYFLPPGCLLGPTGLAMEAGMTARPPSVSIDANGDLLVDPGGLSARSLAIHDASGRSILDIRPTGAALERIPKGGLAPGVYLLVVRSVKDAHVLRFVME